MQPSSSFECIRLDIHVKEQKRMRFALNRIVSIIVGEIGYQSYCENRDHNRKYYGNEGSSNINKSFLNYGE